MSKHRGNITLGIILFIVMFLIPFLSLGGKNHTNSSKGITHSTAPEKQSSPAEAGNSFKLLDKQSGKVLTVDDRTFLYGAVAAEMSPNAEPEALKAQAVASYTYYSRLRENERKSTDTSLNGADFKVDTENWQIYVPIDEMEKKWGNNFDAYYKKIATAANAVYGQTMTYGGNLIDATYYAISSGNTESSKDIWGGGTTYLVSVASPGDIFAGGYKTSADFSQDEFKSRIMKISPNSALSGDASEWVGKIERTAAGSVKNIEVGGQKITGDKIRSAFSLRSANFTVSFSDGKFTFSVKGYGHGVGMSQAGAQYMAREGATYDQILSWYYPTAKLTKT